MKTKTHIFSICCEAGRQTGIIISDFDIVNWGTEQVSHVGEAFTYMWVHSEWGVDLICELSWVPSVGSNPDISEALSLLFKKGVWEKGTQVGIYRGGMATIMSWWLSAPFHTLLLRGLFCFFPVPWNILDITIFKGSIVFHSVAVPQYMKSSPTLGAVSDL